MEPQRLVIGAFGPFGGKWFNNAELVSQRLEQRHAAGQLKIPDQVEVHFLPLDCSPEGIQDFVQKAQQLQADRVLVMGESGFRTRIARPGPLIGASPPGCSRARPKRSCPGPIARTSWPPGLRWKRWLETRSAFSPTTRVSSTATTLTTRPSRLVSTRSSCTCPRAFWGWPARPAGPATRSSRSSRHGI